jgi:hypothetical protein
VNLNDTFNLQGERQRILTRSSEVTGSWVINPDWLAIGENFERWVFAEALIGPEVAELWAEDEELIVTPETPSLAMVDRRTYITSPFTVSYDATSCESDTVAWASVDIERSNVEAFLTIDGARRWTPVEFEFEEEEAGEFATRYSATPLIGLARDGEFRGEAYLLKTRTSSDGDGRTSRYAWDVFNDDGSANETGISGESGNTELRAVTKLYGELSQNAQLRTQYGFWMEVFPYGDPQD